MKSEETQPYTYMAPFSLKTGKFAYMPPQGEYHMKMKTETGVMFLQAKEHKTGKHLVLQPVRRIFFFQIRASVVLLINLC